MEEDFLYNGLRSAMAAFGLSGKMFLEEIHLAYFPWTKNKCAKDTYRHNMCLVKGIFVKMDDSFERRQVLNDFKAAENLQLTPDNVNSVVKPYLEQIANECNYTGPDKVQRGIDYFNENLNNLKNLRQGTKEEINKNMQKAKDFFSTLVKLSPDHRFAEGLF